MRRFLDARRLPTRGVLLGVAAAVVVVVVTGCAPRSDAPPLAPDAHETTTVDCRTEGTWWDLAPETSDADVPVPGRVPDGFDAVAALRCRIVDLPTAPVNGTFPPATVQIERWEGDLDPLLDALADADDPVPKDFACTADMELVRPLWLESADGTVIPVRYPRNACGKTKPAVTEALERLELVAVTDAPVTG